MTEESKLVHLIPSWIQSTSKQCNSNNKWNKIAINTDSKCYNFNAAKLKVKHLLLVLTSILFLLLWYQTKWDDKHIKKIEP
jgi:hypothetical protein